VPLAQGVKDAATSAKDAATSAKDAAVSAASKATTAASKAAVAAKKATPETSGPASAKKPIDIPPTSEILKSVAQPNPAPGKGPVQAAARDEAVSEAQEPALRAAARVAGDKAK
ncbi:hypothetical protein Agub_g529, partial [Astrephomene gubernaculifera]